MEKLLEEVGFELERLDADGGRGYVDSQLASIARNTDLSKYVR